MLPEWYDVSAEAMALIQKTRSEKKRVISVGTTSTRTLETIAAKSTAAEPALQGWTDLYINPQHPLKAIDALITNFHLPRSSPLILASTFVGRERLLAAYQEAIKRGYKLYSYGDAMLIL